MAGAECLAFSEDGKYFGHCGNDGKLKIWDTETGILTQEYTPNLHLSSPCTCIRWISSKNLQSSARKKKKRKSSGVNDVVVLGTVSGCVLLYSVTSASVVSQLDGHSSTVNAVTWRTDCNLFTCGEDRYIVEWDIEEKAVKSKWKAGTERISCLLVLPEGKSLLVAGNAIALWDVESKQLVRKFTGHASAVTSLTLVPGCGDMYFISSSQGDRLVNAWSLQSESKEKNAIVSFVMEDVATCISMSSSAEGEPSTMAAVTQSGVVNMYRHQLNGKCHKPLKPKVTLSIVSEANQNADKVQSIPILAAQLQNGSLLVAYGSPPFLTFEKMAPSFEDKVLVLVRQDTRKSVPKQEAASKVKVPETGDSVEYITPVGAAAASIPHTKKNRKSESDLPMEERLVNLSLAKPESSRETPRADNMAQLLIQGLHSKDRKILQTVLMRREQSFISNTVLRLPVQAVVPLVKELVALAQGKTVVSSIAVMWLKCVLSMHAGHLLANPEIAETFSPIIGLAESLMGHMPQLSRLRGRLDLLVDQIKESNQRANATQDMSESVLVYQDEDSDDGSVLNDGASGSESEDDVWDELSDAPESMDSEPDNQGEELQDVEMTSD